MATSYIYKPKRNFVGNALNYEDTLNFNDQLNGTAQPTTWTFTNKTS